MRRAKFDAPQEGQTLRVTGYWIEIGAEPKTGYFMVELAESPHFLDDFVLIGNDILTLLKANSLILLIGLVSIILLILLLARKGG